MCVTSCDILCCGICRSGFMEMSCVGMFSMVCLMGWVIPTAVCVV